MEISAVAVAFATLVALQTPALANITEVNGVQLIVSGPDPAPAHAARGLAAPHRLTQREQQARLPSLQPAAALLAQQPGDRVGNLLAFAERFLGTPYVWGGASPAGFDCSGFVQYAFRGVGVAIPRTADVQFDWGRPISGDPVAGDLVFFQTYVAGPSHVGLYLGNGWFINSVGTHVQYSSFASAYFRERYLGARRVLPLA